MWGGNDKQNKTITWMIRDDFSAKQPSGISSYSLFLSSFPLFSFFPFPSLSFFLHPKLVDVIKASFQLPPLNYRSDDIIAQVNLGTGSLFMSWWFFTGVLSFATLRKDNILSHFAKKTFSPRLNNINAWLWCDKLMMIVLAPCVRDSPTRRGPPLQTVFSSSSFSP